MGEGDSRQEQAEGPALAYFKELVDPSVALAWGPDKSPEGRRRTVLAATIFGRQFEERMGESRPASPYERVPTLPRGPDDYRGPAARGARGPVPRPAGFMADVCTQGYVLELNEVLEGHAASPEHPPNEHLHAAVESRQEKTRWSRHWSSG